MKFHNHIVAPGRVFVRSLAICLAIFGVAAAPITGWAAKPDRTPPTVPTGLTATAISCSQVNLSWNASTDASGIKQYNVYRNSTLIKTVVAPATSTSDTTVSGATTYSYTVSAVDNKGNTSAQSSAAVVTTPSCTTTTITISLSASPVGAGAPSGGGTVAVNSTVTVTANPSSCYNFVSWTENGTVVSTSASYSFTATANRSLVANFSQKSYSVSVGGTAGGTVSGGGNYNCGSTATVTATASSCYHFVNWTENGTVVSASASYSFTVSASRSLVANFAQNTYTISTGVSPASSGSTTGSGTYGCGSTVTVSATPASCYQFVNWTENGVVVSTSASYSFMASANRSLVANFAQNTYTISTGVSPASSGSTTGAGTYNCGSTVTVSATAVAGYSFANWTENGTVVSTSASYSFSASASRTLTANFSAAACSYSLSSTSASLPATGGFTSFGITAGSSCSWTASTAYNWITVNTGSGMGNGNIYYTVATNASTTARSGTITVAGQTFTINQAGDTSAPTVSLTSPLSGSTLSNTVPTSANASDSSTSVSKVEFYRDGGVLIGTATGSSYSVNWDTTSVSNGTHSVYAKAYDAAGNVTTTAANAVTVNNAVASTATPPGKLQLVKTLFDPNGGNIYVTSDAVDSSGNIIVAGYFVGNVDFGGGIASSTFYTSAFVAKYNAQTNLVWGKVFSSSGNNSVRSVSVDSLGNVIVVGNFSATVDFSGSGVSGATLSSAGNEIFIAKYSSSGTFGWARHFGLVSTGAGNIVAIDANNNIVITAILLGATTLDSYSVNINGVADVLIAKFSAQGVTQWAESIGGTSYNYPGAVTVDRNGDVAVTGYFQNSIDLGGGALAGAGSYDIFLSKYSGATGGYLWGKVFGSTGSDRGYGVTTDPNTGNILLTGLFNGVVDFGGGGMTTAGNGGIFVSAYDPNGRYLWALTTGGSGDFGASIASDIHGNLALTGTSTSGTSFGGSTLIGNGQPNYFVASFSMAGLNSSPTYKWGTYVGQGTDGTSKGYAVTLDPNGRVVVGGTFTGTIDFGGGGINSGVWGYSSGFVAAYGN